MVIRLLLYGRFEQFPTESDLLDLPDFGGCWCQLPVVEGTANLPSNCYVPLKILTLNRKLYGPGGDSQAILWDPTEKIVSLVGPLKTCYQQL